MIGRRIFNDDSSGCDPKADEFKSMVNAKQTSCDVFVTLPTGVQAKQTNHIWFKSMY